MKKIILLSLILCTQFLTSCQWFKPIRAHADGPIVGGAPAADVDPKMIEHSFQLTQVGPRSGEAYFSPDGKNLILQSERYPGNPFYQIYSLNLESGKMTLISTGSGKTTCSWFHPSMTKALFSSTHLDPGFAKKALDEQVERLKPQKGKYSWSFDDSFDIFERDFKTQKISRLTSAAGYDAEGSYSPDGKWILFASNRSGYTDKLTDEEKKLFEQDPSSQMELYLMKAGQPEDPVKNLPKRLTQHLGYDGGPFFSHDGKKITWRSFSANGVSAEIWTMDFDGSHQKELTHWKAMSWAPFFHPSGDYIIFTSNKLGFANFELFIVDAKGEHEPVRVSYLDGFDGLPVFSPDGKRVVWTHKDEKGESQVYSADWNDAKARDLLGLPALPPRAQDLSGEMKSEDAKKIVNYLASRSLAGRLTASPEEMKMSPALGELMHGMGLEPGFEGSYSQPFEFSSGVDLGPQNQLKFAFERNNVDLNAKEDFTPLSFSQSGKFSQAPVAFAGYGLVAPASEKNAGYDSYKDLDVKGKWVLIFRDIPEDIPNTQRIFLNQVSRLHNKALVAKQAGALGLLIASGPNASSGKMIGKFRFEGGFAETGIPVISVSDRVADLILGSTGQTLKSWQSELDKGEIRGVSELKNTKLEAQVDLIQQQSKALNTLGEIKVSGAKETLVIGAHGDHLGRGETGSSLARGTDIGQIHFGADDNASGVAALLMLAQNLKKEIKEGKFHPKQNIVFSIWSGEEIGLLGSSHFLKVNKRKISAYLNMDMVGRLRETLLVQGAGSAVEWREALEPIGIRHRVSMSIQNDPYLPSDSMIFYMKQIPTVMFFTGVHGDYHTPKDTPDTLNYEGISKIASMMKDLVKTIPRLTYLKVESSHKPMEGRSFRVYLGTIPDYAQEKVKGVSISGTSKDSPAEKAGLIAGDILKSLAGTKIENLYDYVYILQGLKPLKAVPMEYERQGKVHKVEIIPLLKE